MQLKEIKSLIKFAKKAGLKSITMGDVTVEFDLTQAQAPKPRLKAVSDKEAPSSPPERIPTLDDINRYIYESDSESA